MPRHINKIAIGLFLSVLLFSSSVFAVEVAPRITDREIIESLAELKAGQRSLQQRFDDVNQRFDDVNQRITDLKESTNKQITDLKESTNKRFDTLQWMLGLFITVALSLFGVMGKILWNQQNRLLTIEASLETQKDELAFLKNLIEKLLLKHGVA